MAHYTYLTLVTGKIYTFLQISVSSDKILKVMQLFHLKLQISRAEYVVNWKYFNSFLGDDYFILEKEI